MSDPSVSTGSRIIVYTRIWNDDAKRYELYAIDHDGTLVPVYDSGSSIEWVAGRLNTLLWNFVEYTWEGSDEPNYYYELYNQYSEQYIAPQVTDGQILSDNTIGINLNGRRNEPEISDEEEEFIDMDFTLNSDDQNYILELQILSLRIHLYLSLLRELYKPQK